MTFQHKIVNRQTPTLSDAGFYGDVRFDPNDGQADFIGLHLTNGASTADKEWKIYKFTYSGSNATRVQLAYGPYDDRVSLF